MGLDIHIIPNNDEEVYSTEYLKRSEEYFNKHSLSRTFCNFMCRKNVVCHSPELDQIGKITNINISPIYEMEEMIDEEDLNISLSFAHTEEKRKMIKEDADRSRTKLEGNIDRVLETLTGLINELNKIENLPELLQPTNRDTLNNSIYFSSFKKDIGGGYIGNNFGQDLRNFKRFLAYMKSKGTKTVWFNYG